jgi:hypothetical protein
MRAVRGVDLKPLIFVSSGKPLRCRLTLQKHIIQLAHERGETCKIAVEQDS